MDYFKVQIKTSDEKIRIVKRNKEYLIVYNDKILSRSTTISSALVKKSAYEVMSDEDLNSSKLFEVHDYFRRGSKSTGRKDKFGSNSMNYVTKDNPASSRELIKFMLKTYDREFGTSYIRFLDDLDSFIEFLGKKGRHKLPKKGHNATTIDSYLEGGFTGTSEVFHALTHESLKQGIYKKFNMTENPSHYTITDIINEVIVVFIQAGITDPKNFFEFEEYLANGFEDLGLDINEKVPAEETAQELAAIFREDSELSEPHKMAVNAALYKLSIDVKGMELIRKAVIDKFLSIFTKTFTRDGNPMDLVDDEYATKLSRWIRNTERKAKILKTKSSYNRTEQT